MYHCCRSLGRSTNLDIDQVLQLANPDAAHRIVALGIDPDVQARIAALADRSNEGLLRTEERAEYASYAEGAEILTLINPKARRFLLTSSG